VVVVPKEKPKVNIGEVIRSYRGQRGLSQGDIERRTGLLRCYLSRVENGHTVPSLETLAKIAEGSGPAPARLEKWLRALFASKQKRFCEDPEMFATYFSLAQEACKTVGAHKECLIDQVAMILSDGVKQGAFQVTDAKATARAIFDATSRFHHPAHADEWSDPASSARIDALLALLLKGLEAPRKR